MAVITLTKDNFEAEVLKADTPVLVDFWAAWCGPCRMLSPVVDEIAEELDGKIKVGKLNVDDEQALAGQYGVMSIPTLILFKDGAVAETSVGVKSKDALLDMIGKVL